MTAPGLFGSKSGSVAIARISPVRGRMTMPVMLMGVCFCIASASAVSTMCWMTASMVSTTFKPSRGCTSSIAQRHQFLLLPVRFRHPPARHAAQRGIQGQFDAVAARGFRNRLAVHRQFIRADKTQHMRRQRAVGIHAQLVVPARRKSPARAGCGRRRGWSWTISFIHAERQIGSSPFESSARFRPAPCAASTT